MYPAVPRRFRDRIGDVGDVAARNAVVVSITDQHVRSLGNHAHGYTFVVFLTEGVMITRWCASRVPSFRGRNDDEVFIALRMAPAIERDGLLLDLLGALGAGVTRSMWSMRVVRAFIGAVEQETGKYQRQGRLQHGQASANNPRACFDGGPGCGDQGSVRLVGRFGRWVKGRHSQDRSHTHATQKTRLAVGNHQRERDSQSTESKHHHETILLTTREMQRGDERHGQCQDQAIAEDAGCCVAIPEDRQVDAAAQELMIERPLDRVALEDSCCNTGDGVK